MSAPSFAKAWAFAHPIIQSLWPKLDIELGRGKTCNLLFCCVNFQSYLKYCNSCYRTNCSMKIEAKSYLFAKEVPFLNAVMFQFSSNTGCILHKLPEDLSNSFE